MTPEFSRPLDVRRLSELELTLTAKESERAALARRFGLVAVDRLEAQVTLVRHGEEVAAAGRLTAHVVQSCAVSGEPLEVAIDEPVAIRFVPARSAALTDEELELAAEDCDQMEYAGGTIDVGEAMAQSLALAIDPYATGPDADLARAAHGLVEEATSGPFAALAALKKPN